MYLGRLVEVAAAKDLFARPRHPYTRMLLDAVPDLAHVGRARVPVSGEIPNPIDPPPGCTFNPRCPWRTTAAAPRSRPCWTASPATRCRRGGPDVWVGRTDACEHRVRPVSSRAP